MRFLGDREQILAAFPEYVRAHQNILADPLKIVETEILVNKSQQKKLRCRALRNSLKLD